MPFLSRRTRPTRDDDREDEDGGETRLDQEAGQETRAPSSVGRSRWPATSRSVFPTMVVAAFRPGFGPPSESAPVNRSSGVVTVVLILAAAGGAFLWWRRPRPALSVPVPVVRAVAPVPAPSAPAAPAIRHPVPLAPSQPRNALPSLEKSDAYLESALIDLLGRKAVRSFFELDDIVRRIVATVDNLATDNASPERWPVNRTAGRLDTEVRDGGIAISAKNAARYAAFVYLADGIDTRRAVALYVRLYPLFQNAYEDLGYPGKYFNDRVIEVIDNLLATPAAAGPIKLKRFEVDGASASSGGLYLFEDPNLEGSSAGQKILLRMGRENARRLMAKLAEVRRELLNGEKMPTATAQ